jgi:uncharacterized protein YigE (DUF2233 family)
MLLAGRVLSGMGVAAAALATLSSVALPGGSGGSRPQPSWTGPLPDLVRGVAQVASVPAAIGAVEARAMREGVRCMGLWAQGSLPGIGDPDARPRPRGGQRHSATQLAQTEPGPWKRIARGVEMRSVEVAPGVVMQQVLLDPGVAPLRLITARNLGTEPLSVPDLARKAHALVAINACYFGQAREPLGYLKVRGRVVTSGVATGSAFTGMLVVRGTQASIVAREAFRPGDGDEVLQAGPRLVVGGRPTAGLLETRSFRQTGVGVTRSGRVLLYATDGSYRGCTWETIRGVLLGPAQRGGVEVTDVLNLDGGSSSQLYVAGTHPVTTGFPTRVPVALGVLEPSPSAARPAR